MHELPDLSRISIEQKDALIRSLFGEVNRLSAQLTALSSQVMELKARQNKNSHKGSTLKRVTTPTQVIVHALPRRSATDVIVVNTMPASFRPM